MTIGHTCPVDGNTNVRTCLDVPETHLVGVLVLTATPEDTQALFAPDVPSAKLVFEALEYLPTHNGIEKALSAQGYEYTFPFGDNYYVRAHSSVQIMFGLIAMCKSLKF